MGFGDTFHFDTQDYYHKCSWLPNSDLVEKHRLKTMRFIPAAMTIGGSIAAAPFTLGTSLAGACYSSRQAHISHQKQVIIERVLIERNQRIPRTRISDCIIGITIGVAGATMSMLAPAAADHFAGLASTSLTGAFPSVLHPAGSAAAQFPTHVVWSNMGHGIHDAIANQYQHGLTHYGSHIPGYHTPGYPTVQSPNSSIAGYDLGYQIVPAVEAMVGQRATDLLFDQLGYRLVRNNR